MASTVDKTRIFVAGHRGMVGSAIIRQLEQDPSVDIITRGRSELDLTNQAQVRQFFAETPLDQVYLAGAKVGGIYANNTYPADFIYQNLMIECNVIHAAFMTGVKKLLFLGSSCIYPRIAEQPITEELLLTGPLEPTNEPYAVAKIAGIKLCESFNRQYGESHGIDYRSVMPTNLYGPGDNYHPENSHVIPGLLRRFHDAKQAGKKIVTVWGSGQALREFLFVDDLAAACRHIMSLPLADYASIVSPQCCHLNVGTGEEISIANLAELVRATVDVRCDIRFDTNRPEGPLRKVVDSDKLRSTGWAPSVTLQDGLRLTHREWMIRT